MILFSSTTLKNPYPNGILIERTTAKEISKPFLANLNGLYPVIKKVKAAARTIPVRLVMSKRKAPKKISKFSHAKPIPETARGGTRATAIRSEEHTSELQSRPHLV